MKKSTLILILFIAWIASSIVAVVFINKYIEAKDARLKNEIRSNVEAIFEGRQDRGNGLVGFDDGIFDVSFSYSPVKNFKKGTIPPRPQKSEYDALGGGDADANFNRRLNEWKENWGNVSSVWNLNWGGHELVEWEDEGWNIVRIYCNGMDDEFIQVSTIFPYQVALKRTEWGNYYTVPQAVNEAFEFYTTDPKSSYIDGFAKGSHREIWNKIHEASNEYYWITENKDKSSHYVGQPIPGGENYEKGGPIQMGSMYNGYYIVFIATTQDKYYKIEKFNWRPDIQERNDLILWWLIGIAVAFLIPIIILLIYKHKEAKRQQETLKQRLLRLCSPQMFMNPYNKDLVDKANSIYPKIQETTTSEELLDLANEAQTLLGISLIEKSELNGLLNKVNPSNFMKPYNADKIAMANELYGILQKSDLKYSEYIDVQNRMKELYK